MSKGIVLCGFKGCGKSTLARAYVQHKGGSYADTDDLIEALYTQRFGVRFSCRKIAEESLEGFRALEREVIASLARDEVDILALGGGSLDDVKNAQQLKRWRCRVYLYVEPCIVWERLAREESLPAILDPQDPKGSFERLFAARHERFSQYVDQVIDVKKALPEQLVEVLR